MDIRVDGQVAVVTGAGRGIGRAVAVSLAEAGAAIGVVDIDRDTAADTVRRITDADGSAIACPADVSAPEQISSATQRIRDALGPITTLVAAAAIDEAVPIHDMTVEQWRHMVNVNLTGVFLSVKAVLPDMRQRGDGRIILFGSNLAEKGGERLAHYCAAKSGVHGLARALARELAPEGIRINVVAPGPVDTDMLRSLPQDWLDAKLAELPLSRFGAVDDIVPTVLLLASDSGSFYTGATMNVSGGDVIP
jgi:3-oxoacyl-[acyl-carrier protein] reductase